MSYSKHITNRILFFICALFCISISINQAHVASAHIVSTGNAYEDISISEFQNEIVYATQLGVVIADESGALFRPNDQLTKADLAYWAAVFQGLTEADQPEVAKQKAVEQGLVDSVEGEATYQDVNTAFFNGQLSLDDQLAQQQLTREQYAAYMIDNAREEVEGLGLQERAGWVQGPDGIVAVVANSEANFGYELVLSDRTYQLSHHPRVIGAPSDPLTWDGLAVTESWLSEQEHGAEVVLLDFRAVGEDIAISEPDTAEQETDVSSEEPAQSEIQQDVVEQEIAAADIEEKAASNSWLTWLSLVLLVAILVIGVIFLRKKRNRE